MSTMAFFLHFPLALCSFSVKLSSFAPLALKARIIFALFSSMYSFLQENVNANLTFSGGGKKRNTGNKVEYLLRLSKYLCEDDLSFSARSLQFLSKIE